MLNIVKTKYIWFSLSGLLLIGSLVMLVLWGLRPSIEFTGGTLWEIDFTGTRPAANDLRSVVGAAISAQNSETTSEDVSLQTAGDNGFLIRSAALSNDVRQRLVADIEQRFGPMEERSFETIGPIIGSELQRRSYQAVVVVLLFIVAYITWAFRKLRGGAVASWKLGVAAVVALAHDIFITIGLFAWLGHSSGVEVGTMFVTALLTVLGFSVHDTIVVFDRFRERARTHPRESLPDQLNYSVNSTLVRSLNTSVTTLLTLTALYLFGGASTHYFVLTLMVGIVTGTYSSIFVASPLLIVMQRRK